MMNFRQILLGMSLASSTWMAMAAPVRYAISIEQITAAVGKTGVEVSPRQITMLTDAVASTPAPILMVRSVERYGNKRMLVRMECVARQDCLPFFVVLDGDPRDSAGGLVSPMPVPGLAAHPGPRSLAVRSGTPATLLLEDDRVHIRIPVVCLENGALGQTIRVRGKENRLIYSAQVLGGALLKGRL